MKGAMYAVAELPTASDTKWLRNIATRLARGPEGDDLAQDAWVAAQQDNAPPGAPRQWLRVVVHRAALMSRRKRARAEANQWRLTDSPREETIETDLHRARVLDAVRIAMEDLSEADRDVVTRRLLHDQDAAEVAKELDLSPGAVRTRLSRAIGRLRGRLDRDFGGREAWAGAFLIRWERPEPLLSSFTTAVVVICIAAAAAAGVWWLSPDGAEPAERAPAAAVPTDPQPEAPETVAEQHKAAPYEERREKIRSAHKAAPPPQPSSTSPAVQLASSFKAFTLELGDTISGCLAAVPESSGGRIEIALHVIAEPDVGAIIDELEISSDTTGNDELKSCVTQSIPAFHMESVDSRFEHDFDFKADLDQRFVYFHTELDIDDVDAYVEMLREQGFEEELVARKSEKLAAMPEPRTKTGFAISFDKIIDPNAPMPPPPPPFAP